MKSNSFGPNVLLFHNAIAEIDNSSLVFHELSSKSEFYVVAIITLADYDMLF